MKRLFFKLSKIFYLTLTGVSLFAGYSSAHEGHEAISIQPMAVSWGLRGVVEMMNPHPLFVHFPIALLLAGLCFISWEASLRK